MRAACNYVMKKRKIHNEMKDILSILNIKNKKKVEIMNKRGKGSLGRLNLLLYFILLKFEIKQII